MLAIRYLSLQDLALTNCQWLLRVRGKLHIRRLWKCVLNDGPLNPRALIFESKAESLLYKRQSISAD